MASNNYDSNLKVWKGPKRESIYNTEIGLGYLIMNVLQKTPEMITQVSADSKIEITCHEMRSRSLKLADHLMKAGFKQNDIVGIVASHSENLTPLIFACFTLGLPINCLATVMNERDIIHMYSKTKPKVIFVDSDIIKTVQGAVIKMNLNAAIYTLVEEVEGYQFVDDVLKEDFKMDDFIFPDLVDVANSIAFIMCSSGTTSLPKGVCKSHRQVIKQIYRSWDMNSDKQEVMLNFSSMYWVSSVYFLIIGALYGMKRVITREAFEVDLMIDTINRYEVSVFLTAPFGLAQFLQKKNLAPFHSMKLFACGGASVSKAHCEAMKPYLPDGKIYIAYGSTEVDFLTESFTAQRLGSVGRTGPNVELKIINENGDNLGPNHEGEVCAKTAVTFSGYFDDPEKTKEAIIDGWVHTGDVGYFDDDGFLYIVDRKKDMLKFNNYQVYPSELEAIICEVEGVIEACVVGVFEENKGNDLIFAFVTKDESNCDLTPEKVLDWVNKNVIDAKKLRGGVHFLDVLPMTPSGKLQRNEVKKIAEKMFAKIIENK